MIIVLLSLIFFNTSFCQAKRESQKSQKVFIQAMGGDIVIDLERNKIRIRLATRYDSNGYLIDNCKFYPNWNFIKEQYEKHEIEKRRFEIKDGKLFLDGRLVNLPGSVKARTVWQAILWNDWVILLGRTSESDKQANSIPPFLASELITFSLKSMKAAVKWVSFQSPHDAEIWVIESICD